MTGASSDDAIAEFLTALRQKTETVDEIVAAAIVMRRHSLKLSRMYPELLDTCGTGGDGSQTFNVSTLAAIVASACGVSVAKHGNRSISSVMGSADLLESLGIKIDLSPAEVEESIKKTGFGFFFAPRFHPAVRFAMPARRKIGGKTIFNILGPLSNPAGAAHQLIGVYDEKLLPIMAQALKQLGSKSALIVHAKEGMDEISLSGPTSVAELKNGEIKFYTIKPQDFGLESTSADKFKVKTKDQACKLAQFILSGAKIGAPVDLVALNAGAALYIAGKASSIREGFKIASDALDFSVAAKLREIINLSVKTPGI